MRQFYKEKFHKLPLRQQNNNEVKQYTNNEELCLVHISGKYCVCQHSSKTSKTNLLCKSMLDFITIINNLGIYRIFKKTIKNISTLNYWGIRVKLKFCLDEPLMSFYPKNLTPTSALLVFSGLQPIESVMKMTQD